MSTSQIHPSSDVQPKFIGEDTKVWQYCVILQEAKIGRNCNICANVLIENDVVVGNNVTIKSGVQLWDGIRVGDDVFIGPNASFTNDRHPKSKQYPKEFLVTVIGKGATIGANATILPGISIGAGAMIGAGSVVTKDVPSNAIVVGNPAVINGYSNTYISGNLTQYAKQDAASFLKVALDINGCFLYYLPLVTDMRGSLSVAEYEQHIPFLPKRCFWVFDVPSREVRGEHAHKTLHEILICVKGSITIVLDDSNFKQEVVLDKPNLALHIPPLVWAIQYKFSSDAVLLVLASENYDSSDYIRDYEEFLEFLKSRKNLV